VASGGELGEADVAKRRNMASGQPAQLAALRRELGRARARIRALEARAEEDPLTGLLNRRGFARVFYRAIAFARRYDATAALFFVDLDGFKRINDRHGHSFGDRVLARVGKLIASHVRASDVVARVGGDEFTILMWNLAEADARVRARELEAFLAAAKLGRGRTSLRVGASIGFTLLRPGDRLATALTRADKAMYSRKRERNGG
jgi:diguanylate cyclase (GGDEF)-like protein